MRLMLTALLTMTCSLGLAQDDALLFYADFDGDAEADYAAGDASVTVNGQVRFIEGRVGQAVVVGGDNWLSYPAAAALDARRGSIEFWVSPVDWDGRDNTDSHFFVGAAGADRIFIYKFARWRHFTFHCRAAGVERYESLRAGIYTWRPGEWHHAVVTWDRAIMRIYLDGELKAEASIPAPLNDLGDTLWVGRELATPQFAR
ncbi:MAG: LamG domain-containing protein, partial [Armatimonadetes bacterium]|nr:LamG domain-containing protein [Armatimonadota bacterium]